MRKTFSLLLTAVAFIAGALVWYRWTYPEYTHRYRLTIEVEVQGEIRSGTGVTEVSWERQPALGNAGPWHTEVRGQAILIDLDARGALLALPVGGPGPIDDGSTSPQFLALRAFAGTHGIPAAKNPSISGYPITAEALKALSDLPPGTTPESFGMPRVVWLPDRASPPTARVIALDQLLDIIGPDVRFREARLEIVDAPVTTDLATKLPWLKAMAAEEKQRRPVLKYGEFKLTAQNLSLRIEP